MNPVFVFRSGITLLLPGILLAGLLSCGRAESLNHDPAAAEASAPKMMFVCSMHPQVIQDKPGDCPICGMSLIEKKARDGNSADEALNDVVLPVNESVLASVQTVAVTSATLPVVIEAAGIISYDSRRITTVSARYPGLIEKSYIKYKFQPVRKGQKIYDIYCPEIYATHMNYVNLLKKFPDNPDLTYEARQWLINIGLTNEQIGKLITDEKPEFHLSVYSDADGYVVGTDFDPGADFTFGGNINNVAGTQPQGTFGTGLTEGSIVDAGTPLFKVINLASVRADLKIRTEDAGLLKVGQNVVITDAVSPGLSTETKISQIEPLNGGLFQVVRVYIADKDKRLYPGMKIQARILAGNNQSLWIPKRAVVDMGQHQAVFLLRDSTFIATEVKTGMSSGDKIELLYGVEEDSRIAANASLLTDSDGFIKTSPQ